jgi:dynein assembly factor 1, axonemal
LDTLNLSNNYITKLENLSCCPLLSSLIITHNCIECTSDLEHLIECKNLTSLDLSYNKITDELALDVFGKMNILVSIFCYN